VIHDDSVRMPGLPPAAAFLAGIASSPWLCAAPLLGCATLAAIVAAVLHRSARSPRAVSTLVALAALLLGALAESRSLAAYEQRGRAACLPIDGTGVDAHLRGTLLAPAEPALDGERVVLVRGRIEQAGSLREPSLDLRLRVSSSPEGPMHVVDTLDPGDTVRFWCRIRRPTAPRNPGSRNGGLRPRGLDAVGRIKSARIVEVVARGESGARRRAGRLKRVARERLDRLLGPATKARAMAGALLLGDRARLDEDSITRLRRAGLMHVIAISGLHVGLLVLTLHEGLRRARIPPWGRFLFLALFLAGFALLVGPRSSVMRSALAAGGALLGRCIGREGDARNGLLLVAGALAVHRPAVLADAGFQLTFLATGGILVLGPRIANVLPFSRIVNAGLSVGVAAYLATAPVVAAHFGLLAPLGIVLGLAAVPVCWFGLLSGYGALLAADMPILSPSLAWCSAAAGNALLEVSSLGAWWPEATLSVPRPSAPVIFVYYALLVLLLRSSSPIGRRSGRKLMLFGLAFVWIHTGPPPPPVGRPAEAAVLDVGQGLSVALRDSAGSVALVDAAGSHVRGYDPGERIVVPFLLDRGIRRVDVLVVTHDHLDHAGGAFAVARELEVGELWLGPGFASSPLLAELVDLALRRGTAVVGVSAGTVAGSGQVRLRVLAPSRSLGPTDSNARSLALLAGTAPARLLVPGDADHAAERAMLERGEPVRAEALVLSHHGSRHSSAREFLSAVDPRYAIVSAGRGNPFRHPHVETLDRVREGRARLLRTDRDGWIRLRARPDGWTVAPGTAD